MIKAILFDLDGTLLETQEFVLGALEYALKKYDYPPLDREKAKTLIGTPLPKYYEILAPGSDKEKMVKAHEDFQLSHTQLVTPFPQVLETLDYLKKQGYKLAVVTNRYSKTLMPILKANNMTGFFGAIVAADHVQNTKPHPEHLLAALNKLNADKSESYMVGDSEFDILAGKNTGVKTIAVSYGNRDKTELEKLNPDFIINSFEELKNILE